MMPLNGRPRSLTTIELKGLTPDRRRSFTATVNALGFRGTLTGTGLVVPTRDAGQIRHLLDIERHGLPEPEPTVTAFDLYDAAWEIEQGDPDAEQVDAFLAAHAAFVEKGPSPSPPRGYAEVVGRAEAVATLIRSGRFERAARTAGRLRATWERSR